MTVYGALGGAGAAGRDIQASEKEALTIIAESTAKNEHWPKYSSSFTTLTKAEILERMKACRGGIRFQKPKKKRRKP